MSAGNGGPTGPAGDAWHRRLAAGCDLALERLAGEPRFRVAALVADIAALRERLLRELPSSETSAARRREIALRIDSRDGGAVVAADLEYVLAALAPDLNGSTIDAIGEALRNAVERAAPELTLTESQAIALLAQIRHARRGESLRPLGAALSRALHS
jgi:hypothetical protein